MAAGAIDLGRRPAAAPGGGRAWPLLRQQRLASALGVAVATVMFGALIIGDRPFAVTAADKAAIAEGGNSFNRAVIFAALAFAVPIGLLHLGRALRLAARSWPVGLIVLWSGLTFIWASHPDLALRRAFAFLLVYLALVCLAAGARSIFDLLVPLAVVFAVVTLLNIVAMTVFPASSWSEIGENGIFDNKNGAGTMAMLAIVILGTALPVVRGRLAPLLLVAVMALAGWFLLATKSKTSIGVAALMGLVGPGLYGLFGGRPALRLAAGLALAAVGLAGLVVFCGLGYDDRDLRLLLFGDLTFTGRTEIWQPLVLEIARRPWLGHGFGSFWDTGELVNPIRAAPPSAWFMDAQLINTAHNGYLDALVQTGIVGFLLVMAAISRCFWLLATAASGAAHGERVVLTGFLCVAICLALNNLLESYLFRTGDTLGYLFTFTVMHVEGVHLRRRDAASLPAAD